MSDARHLPLFSAALLPNNYRRTGHFLHFILTLVSGRKDSNPGWGANRVLINKKTLVEAAKSPMAQFVEKARLWIDRAITGFRAKTVNGNQYRALGRFRQKGYRGSKAKPTVNGLF